MFTCPACERYYVVAQTAIMLKNQYKLNTNRYLYIITIIKLSIITQ